MGTRSITVVRDDEGNKIIEMYKQYDGYPSGMGMELMNFLKGGVVVNGYSTSSDNVRQFNGMECLAAQLVAHFKEGVGGIYLHAPTPRHESMYYADRYGVDYVYFINTDLSIECRDAHTGDLIILEEEIE